MVTADACNNHYCNQFEEVAQACKGQTSSVYIEAENILCLTGRLASDKTNLALIESFPLRQNLRVGLSSEGGDIDIAMDIVEHLEKFQYTAFVHGICASACAQFLFMGAERKVIGANGVVGMHGGPFSDGQIDAMDRSESSKEIIRTTRNRFVKFYEDRDINIKVTYDFPKELLDQLAQGKIVFWIPLKNDFDRYAVKGLVYCNPKFNFLS